MCVFICCVWLFWLWITWLLFWSLDTFCCFAVRKHCASWDWTITCSNHLIPHLCVLSQVRYSHSTYRILHVAHLLSILLSFMTCSNHLIPHLCVLSQIAQFTLVLSFISIAPEQALACLPHHARNAHSLIHSRPLAHSSAHTPQLHPLCGRLTAHSSLSNPNLHPSS